MTDGMGLKVFCAFRGEFWGCLYLNMDIQWNTDFSNLQGKQKLVNIREFENSGVNSGKITEFDWEKGTTFGSSYRKIRKNEGSRNRDFILDVMQLSMLCPRGGPRDEVGTLNVPTLSCAPPLGHNIDRCISTLQCNVLLAYCVGSVA